MDKRYSLDLSTQSLLSLPLQARVNPTVSGVGTSLSNAHQRSHSLSATSSPSLSYASSPSRSPSPSSPTGNTGNGKSNSGSTFVHKLHTMVTDKKYQHLISWNITGTSFVVSNITDFAREVLPVHFKHSNFSSFVRQLNMYGFHKVNKSPRGHRTLVENQVWEFSHSKFVRGRPDLLEEIKRKSMESESLRREAGDLHSHLAVMQVAQSDILQQIAHLQENFSEVVRELAETKRKQSIQQNMLKTLIQYMQTQNTHGLPPGLSVDAIDHRIEPERPSIYITNADSANSGFFEQPAPGGHGHSLSVDAAQLNAARNSLSASPTYRAASPLLAQQLGAHTYLHTPANVAMQVTLSGSHLAAYNQAVNTPLPPSPVPSSPMAPPSMDDDMRQQTILYPSPNHHTGMLDAGMASPFFPM